MKQLIPEQPGRRPTSPPRTHGTPNGYRNLRVLVTTALHYRLVALAAQSELSLPELVVRTLDRATPLDPLTGQPVADDKLAGAPRLHPGQVDHESPSPGPMPGATHLGPGAIPGQVATPGSLGGPPAAQGQGNAHPQGAGAKSAPHPGIDPFLIVASPTVPLDHSGPHQAESNDEAKRHE
jgi:hypothetical protein